MGKKHAQKYRWFCQCMMDTGERVYLVATAETEAEANRLIHINYAVDYVEDIRTPEEMREHTHYLRPTYIGIAQFIPWWTSKPSGKKDGNQVAENIREGTYNARITHEIS